MFEELHKETEEAEDVKAKKEKAVADDSKGGETTAKALNLDDDYSSPVSGVLLELSPLLISIMMLLSRQLTGFVINSPMCCHQSPRFSLRI